MSDKAPTLTIYAGPNGSGKTTAAKYLLNLPGSETQDFINADEIARGLSPINPEAGNVAAGRLMLKRMKDFLQQKKSFAFETTLSSKSYLKYLKKAREYGYSVKLFYFYTGNVEVNIKRIEERVKQEGHDVPEDIVRRRYERSMYNFYKVYWGYCDTINLFDTSQGGLTVFLLRTVDGKLFNKDHKIWDEIQK